MTAAALTKIVDVQKCSVTLIESDDIGTVGVGEATLPHLRFFNQKLGIDEREFMRATESTFKLGIEFVNWGQLGSKYMHAFGEYGEKSHGVEFHHLWLKAFQKGDAKPLSDYSLAVNAAKQQKFQFPDPNPDSVLSKYSYAYHVDAALYAKFLRSLSEKRGIKRKEGKVQEVVQCSETGFINELVLHSGERISGDLFIDCSGFRGLLIEQSLKTGYQDWSHYLPCDSAQAVPCERVEPLLPYTRSTAHSAGWQWRIPLQHRTGNGHVYSSKFMPDDVARDILLANIDGKALRDPIQLRFTTGKRNKFWNKNCIAIGLSGGFLEPLESTSIYLIQDAITHLMQLFPDKNCDTNLADEFNRVMDAEFYHIRDFLIAHYHVTQRSDSPFWEYLRNMDIPDTLQHKLDMYQSRGHIIKYASGEFLDPSWLAVLTGQGLTPEHFHPTIANMPQEHVSSLMHEHLSRVQEGVASMNANDLTLQQYLSDDGARLNRSYASSSLYGN
ncbi:tryptophan halogenase family protein [Ningiella sp. W23]|uniref:tryptophan halogenase family protein n=1 Tax=Ningiella sp. W23 TaxID=3023715 RepID=UPI00375682BF